MSDMQFTCAVGNPHSPNVKVLGAAGAPATTEEAESHLEFARSNGPVKKVRSKKDEEERREEVKGSSLVSICVGIFPFFSLSQIYRNMARYARLVRLAGPQVECSGSGDLFFSRFFLFLFSFSVASETD